MKPHNSPTCSLHVHTTTHKLQELCTVLKKNLIWKLLMQKQIYTPCNASPPSHPLFSPALSLSLSLGSESDLTLETNWKERGGVVFSKVCQKPRGLYLPRISMGG